MLQFDKKRLAPWLLLLTAAIWGMAFVAQRKGMEYAGPLTFNGLRFLLGALALVPFIIRYRSSVRPEAHWFNPRLLLHAAMASVALFLGSAFQQVGIVYTTAGKAGFITSCYIVLVPFYGLLTGNRPGMAYWSGTAIVLAGLFLLTRETDFNLRMGDMLVLISAVFWAMHIIVLGKVSALHHVVLLAFWQFIFAGFLSLVPGLLLEPFDGSMLLRGWWPLVYAGVFSAGIGFTLQVAGQKHVKPELTGLILSFEALFAVLGGFLVLGERLDVYALTGCALMLAGLLLAQYQRNTEQKCTSSTNE
ncbi:MAG TPA: DMT family transporter [Bacteroidales bacterium]|nr:DMT family transporter [Bacteroidales bacterium]